MTFTQVWIFPFCAFVFSILAFVVSYIIAVKNDHVKALVPYISDSGALPPESCIFGQLLNLAALFLAITFYLRHRQIVEFYWHRLKQVGRWRFVSVVLLWLGYISAFGVSIIANFQEIHVIFVHYFGALMAFGFGLLYAWAQTVFSYRMNPKLAKPVVSHCRLFLCALSTIFFIIMILFGGVYGRQPSNKNDTNCYYLYKWTGEEPNYYEHMIGTVSEWMLAICFQLYILSFATELQNAYCHAPKLKLNAIYEIDSKTEFGVGNAVRSLSQKLESQLIAVENKSSKFFGVRIFGTENNYTSPPTKNKTDIILKNLKDFKNLKTLPTVHLINLEKYKKQGKMFEDLYNLETDQNSVIQMTLLRSLKKSTNNEFAKNNLINSVKF